MNDQTLNTYRLCTVALLIAGSVTKDTVLLLLALAFGILTLWGSSHE